MPESKERERPTVPPADSAIARVVKDPVSRRKFMALTGGSAALAAFLAACGSDSGTTTTSTASSGGTTGTEQFGKGDIGILNYALTLEYLETAFYKDVIKSGLFKGADLEMMRKFGSEEAEHVSALAAAVKQMGGTPAPAPKTKFALKNKKSALELASTLEGLGAAAYLGQMPNIQSPSVLASALAIHSVEARHASAINSLHGESVAPNGALARPADAETVLKLVEPFIVG